MPPPPRRQRLTPKLTRGAAYLLGGVALLFLIWLFGGESLQAQFLTYLALTPESVFQQGHVWKLVTSPFVYPSSNAAIQLLLDGLVIWFMAPVLEKWWGTNRFLRFVAATAIGGTLIGALVGLAVNPHAVVFGLGPFIWGNIVAFGVLFARQPVQLFGTIPIQGRSLAIGAAALMLLMVLLERQWVSGAASFAGMGIAYVMTAGFTPNLWLLKLRRWWMKRRLGVVDGGKKPDKQRWMN